MRDRIKSGLPIFDAAAFVQPEDGRGFYGNSARDILTGPGAATWNTVLAKYFAVTERARWQFRWELYNVFNRPNFDPPPKDSICEASLSPCVHSLRMCDPGTASARSSSMVRDHIVTRPTRGSNGLSRTCGRKCLKTRVVQSVSKGASGAKSAFLYRG